MGVTEATFVKAREQISRYRALDVATVHKSEVADRVVFLESNLKEIQGRVLFTKGITWTVSVHVIVVIDVSVLKER